MPKQKKKGNLTDAELAGLSRRRKKAMELESKYKSRKDRLSKKIGKEMRLRGTRLQESNGVRTTWTVQERTEYDFFGIERDLLQRYGRKEGRKLVNLIRPKAVDASALSRLIQAGEIEPIIAEANSKTVIHAQYPSITILSDPEDDE